MLKKKGKLRIREYREMTGLSDEGVRIELNELVKKVFLSKGKGRGTHYVIK